MSTQSEKVLEDNLVKQLTTLGYEQVVISNEAGLLANLKRQLERHNKVELTINEFSRVLNHLNKGNVFDRSKILRDRMQLTRDNGESIYLEFLELDHWCQNLFQVTHQVTVEGTWKNRYDVTILVNGFPLVQIELKRRGLELKEAFNQVNRYQRHSFWSAYGLFQYVQIFIISNGVNTKYYANNRQQSFKQTFFWTDKENHLITQLDQFAMLFLDPCHLSKMITQYIVLNETYQSLMVLRPYQFYATEAIIDRVQNSVNNGYIWHTTGSGKTLTSFKTSQVLIRLPHVHKVVFVVDRKDLDYQTIREFNSFSKGSIDGTNNTSALVQQFTDDTKLIVTTIQKLNNAISGTWFQQKMEKQKKERIIFIFDECHRSQFGETHARIRKFFTKAQMFGFTGTPIFAENAVGNRTTKDLFGDCLHKYVITDAIRDDNVLKFLVEYVGRYKEKEGSPTNVDFDAVNLEAPELMEAEKRLEKIVDYIIEDFPRKTHSRSFNGMFCVNSVDMLKSYYDLFRRRKEEGRHNLKVGTIFSYVANEEDKDATGDMTDESFSLTGELPIAADKKEGYVVNMHSRDKLEEYIGDYNAMFNTKFTTRDPQSFYNYYNDISRRTKNRELDILLVVNMFLTGFDSPRTNTLYVDKNLRYHGIIQAFSRTNRILNEQKSQGNIICFRNLKERTDEAVALFSNKEAKEKIWDDPYEVYRDNLNQAMVELYKITPTVNAVDALPSETERLKFILAFREIMRTLNVAKVFADFSWDHYCMSEQTFNDFKSKYLDLYQGGSIGTGTSEGEEPGIDDIDFELELIHRDEINVAYILALLAKMKESDPAEREKRRQEIVNLLAGETNLRPKRELIHRFMEEELPSIADVEDIPVRFETFWTTEQNKAFERIVAEENLVPEKLDDVIQDYLFTNRKPRREQVIGLLREQPKLLERKTITERIMDRLMGYVETFVEKMG